jgi:hypothetical protein
LDFLCKKIFFAKFCFKIQTDKFFVKKPKKNSSAKPPAAPTAVKSPKRACPAAAQRRHVGPFGAGGFVVSVGAGPSGLAAPPAKPSST